MNVEQRMILRERQNICRKEHAGRAAVLIDAAAYFGAVRSALLNARRRVFILGWDIHSRAPLVGESGKADDGYPEALGDFLGALVRKRPQLEIYVLLWDFAVLYAAERELFPTYALRWNTPRRVRFCLDNAVPIGSSQHQKLIVVDDAVAFSGGLDVTIRRWDTSAHEVDNPLRRDPGGKSYKPFHDVQAIVDGEAAYALAHLARSRWECAAGDKIRLGRIGNDPWPQEVVPDFTDVEVGIARTQPEYDGQKEVREVQALFLNSIAQAEHAIYIENQFLSNLLVAEALARRLRERPKLEVLILAPSTHKSWLEARSMRNGRIRFMRQLADKDIASRVRLLYPQVSAGGHSADVMVHSKVMIVDDKLLRIGSANLNNRSMGTDTECDLMLLAKTKGERDKILEIRHRLLGDHCGCSAEQVAEAVAKQGSLLKVADTLTCNGHRLCLIEDGEPDANELAHYIEGVADPERPIGAEDFVSSMLGGVVPRRHVPTVMKVLAAGLVILAAALIWEYSPLATVVNPGVIAAGLNEFARGPWGPFIVVFCFVAGGLVIFPVTVLIAATAATFGPWLGFTYATTGTILSALVTYALGALLGKKTLRDLLGPKLNRIRRKIARRGVIAVAAIRLVPLAPFTVVNLVAGASAIALSQYMIGTLIGMVPGIFVMSVLGHQLSQMVLHPTPGSLALLAGAVVAWIAVSIGLQALVSKYADAKS